MWEWLMPTTAKRMRGGRGCGDESITRSARLRSFPAPPRVQASAASGSAAIAAADPAVVLRNSRLATLRCDMARSDPGSLRPIHDGAENRNPPALRSRLGVVSRHDSQRVLTLRQAVRVPQVVVVGALADVCVDRPGTLAV